jgi:transcriptional regulator with XRE-family HTH domain
VGEIARRVRDRRLELGLSVAKTAKDAEISRTYLTKIEHAEHDGAISGKVLFNLSRVLGTTPAYLLGVAEEEGPLPLPPDVLAYGRTKNPDLRLFAGAVAAYLGSTERPLTRDDWVLFFQALLDAMVARAETASQRRSAAIFASSMVDEALAEVDRERNSRVGEKLLSLAARIALDSRRREVTDDEEMPEADEVAVPPFLSHES